MSYKKKLLNLYITSILFDNAADPFRFMARAFYNGLSGLKNRRIPVLENLVYSQYAPSMDQELREKLASDKAAFKKWVMEKQVNVYLEDERS